MNTVKKISLLVKSLLLIAKAWLLERMRLVYVPILVLSLMTNSASSAVMDDISADMGNNEAPLLNAPVGPSWAVKAYIGMGSAARGDATPTWWQPSNLTYKSSMDWNVIVPWFVIYPGAGNAASNVRVKVYGILIYMLDKTTNKWVKIDTGLGKPTWGSNYDFNLVTWKSPANKRLESDGNLSYKLPPESYPMHGGFDKLDISKYINPSNIAAVFVHIKTQLILDDPMGVDDRALAKILVNIGADYYPSMTTTVSDFSPMQYVPSSGGSRFGLVKAVPRSHYFATIDPPGSLNPDTVYIQSGGTVVIPSGDFAANMPPFLTDTVAPSAPSSLTAKVKKTGRSASVSLSWNASTDNTAVTGYNIYRNGIKINTTSSLNYKDTITTLPSGTLYSYTVRSFDNAGNLSTPSSAALITY
jgi:hypothetical protein